MADEPTVNEHRLNPVDGPVRRLSFRLWAPRCAVCGGRCEAPRELCAPCADEAPTNRTGCIRCAMPLAETTTVPCGDCQQHAPPFDRLIAPFRYSHPIDGLLQRFKFQRDLAAGTVLADLLADALAAQPNPDVVVAVPLHPSRLRERGYNQSVELARRIAAQRHWPLADALLRVRATAAQAQLDAAARTANVRGAFLADPEQIRGRHVLLIDDVVTTTATVRECARALQRAGATQVVVAAVARAV